MDVKNFVGLLVFGVVGIIVISAFVPIIAETTDATEDFTNTGKWNMSKNENGQIFSYDNTTHEWSLNGVVVNSAYNSGLNVILLDDLCIRSNGWIRGAQLTGNSVTTVVTNANDQTVISGNGLSGNGTYTQQGYGVNPDGDYILTDYNVPVYMNGDSQIYATGITVVASTFDGIFHIEGSINDGVTINAYTIRNGSYTISDVTFDNIVIHYTPVAGYIDLYKLEGITFDFSCVATPTGEGDAVTITDFGVSYSSYVVPYEITAEKAVHPDEALASVIDLLPLIVGIGLFLILVAEFLYSRYL